MKKFFFLLIFLAFSCAGKSETDPLIVPPNFTEIPDVTKPEKASVKQKEENVTRLKELLLKSD